MKFSFAFLCTIIILHFYLDSSAQDIIYTISGEIESKKTSLDSIAIENLNNQTITGFGNLPERDDYRINLTRNEYWGSTSINKFWEPSGFQLVKNIPGRLAIAYWGQHSVNANIALNNINGQRLALEKNFMLVNGSVVEVEIGNPGIYFLTISTPLEILSYKALGILMGGNTTITSLLGDAIPLKSRKVYTAQDINAIKGDSVRISVFKTGYVAQPIELSIDSNETLVFPLETPTPTEVQTNEATYVLNNSATLNGNVISTGNTPIVIKGFYWSSTNKIPGATDSLNIVTDTSNNFSITLTGLTKATTYYVRAFATNSMGANYGDPISFKTEYWQRDTETAVVDVYNPLTGKTWMDRNLGSSRVATGKYDQLAYGDLYQWGRAADGHQKRNSLTTSSLSNTDNPDHGLFILSNSSSNYDWRSPQNTNLWKGLNGVNNPCPQGYRVPTAEEWADEYKYWGNYNNNLRGAFDSPLKLSAQGVRYSNGNIVSADWGYQWTSDLNGNQSSNLIIFPEDGSNSTAIGVYITRSERGKGYSVRCIKESGMTYSLPGVTTTIISNINQNTASAGGKVNITGGRDILTKGVCWNNTGNPTIADSKTMNGSGTAPFVSSMTGLLANTTYYVRAYATNSQGTSYGEEVEFQTLPPTLPAVSTNDITNISYTKATTGGNITSDGGVTVTRGVCWNTSGNPTTDDNKTVEGTGTGTFISNLTGLIANTTYYVRAYASNSEGTVYGRSIEFKTLPLTLPVISTTNILNISYTTATGNSTITSDGGTAITSRGVCWNTTGNPTIADILTSDGKGVGSFPSYLTGLTANTSYYVRTYATNSLGTIYGPTVEFKTLQFTLPGVTTKDVSSISYTKAASGGNVTSDGGLSVTARGVCWNTTGNPTIADSKTIDGAGTGSYNSKLTDLTANTTYYVRSYATNELGTKYGQTIEFKTLALTIAEVNTRFVSSITFTTAKCACELISDGGLTVTERGICWNTTGNPTLTDSKTIDITTGSALFNPDITGLTANTTYFVRAYAINSKGTAYGQVLEFKTLAITTPSVSTREISGITFSTATAIGMITSDGGVAVLISGVCWNTTGNPTISDSKTTDGSLTGLFSSTVTGLQENTTYHFRAYATNSIGTAYGQTIKFTTCPETWPKDTLTSVVDVINPTTGKTWMDRNLGASRAAISSNDDQSYGDLYQWGRAADGHEKRNSLTTSTQSSTDTPGHSNFILSKSGDIIGDWRKPQNKNLWQGVNGVNNPCPNGYRLPTDAELDAERLSWSSNNAAGAFSSPLKLPVAGDRNSLSGMVTSDNKIGFYQSSTLDVSVNHRMYFSENSADAKNDAARSNGNSVRCIKD